MVKTKKIKKNDEYFIHLKVSSDSKETVEIKVDQEQLNMILWNLCLNKMLYRKDGPSIHSEDGSQEIWMRDGEFHRVGGPAVINQSIKEYRVNGRMFDITTEAEDYIIKCIESDDFSKNDLALFLTDENEYIRKAAKKIIKIAKKIS